MSKRYPGGFIFRSNPTIVGPTNQGAGLEGGSAPGVWTLEQAGYYVKQSLWPKPFIPKTLYTWGQNNYGQLGQNDLVYRSSPTQVGSLTTWASISLSNIHGMAAIASDKTLWTWGRNQYGQLGQNDIVYRSSPTQVGALTNWRTVYAGETSFAVKNDGTLWGWGYNNNGQLGINNRTNRSSPVQVGSDTNWVKVVCGNRTSIGIKTDGSIWVWGDNSNGVFGDNTAGTARSSPVQIGSLTNWSDVCSPPSGIFVLALKTDNSLWAWGSNGVGQLGINNIAARSSPVQIGALTNWNYIAAGQEFCAVVKTDNTLWVWGSSNRGQLGQNDLVNRSSPVQVGTQTNWGRVSCLANSFHSIKTDGTLWACGENFGRLGDNTSINRSSPIQIGALTTWAVMPTTAGTEATGMINAPSLEKSNLWVAGQNASGQLGQNNLVYRSSPVLISSRTSWTSASVGLTSSALATIAAVKTDGTLWAWGNNADGQLGQNDVVLRSVPTQIGTDANWSAVRPGGSFTIALKTNGTLWSFGTNAQGQLGLNLASGDSRSSPVQIGALTTWTKIAIGSGISNHTLAIQNGTLWAWGDNASGGLGLNDIARRSSPVQVGALNNWADIAVAGGSSLAVKTDGTLWSWGANSNGVLGQNDVVNRSSPVQVGALTNWSKVSCGQVTSYALKTDGTLWAWGRNNNGQLGQNDTVNRSSPVQIGALTTWSSLGSGYESGYATQSNGTLWAWGRNDLGQLGTNDLVNLSSPAQVGSQTNWSIASAGGLSLVALTT